jgi:hypothetical protein
MPSVACQIEPSRDIANPPEPTQAGANTDGLVLHVAARHWDGEWVTVHATNETSVPTNLDKIDGADAATALWVDRRSGNPLAIRNYPTTRKRRPRRNRVR